MAWLCLWPWLGRELSALVSLLLTFARCSRCPLSPYTVSAEPEKCSQCLYDCVCDCVYVCVMCRSVFTYAILYMPDKQTNCAIFRCRYCSPSYSHFYCNSWSCCDSYVCKPLPLAQILTQLVSHTLTHTHTHAPHSSLVRQVLKKKEITKTKNKNKSTNNLQVEQRLHLDLAIYVCTYVSYLHPTPQPCLPLLLTVSLCVCLFLAKWNARNSLPALGLWCETFWYPERTHNSHAK